MKNKILSKAYGGVTEARHRLYGLGLPRQWKVITSTLLLLFTFAIGNVWAAATDMEYTYTFESSAAKVTGPAVDEFFTASAPTQSGSYTVQANSGNLRYKTSTAGAETTVSFVFTAKEALNISAVTLNNMANSDKIKAVKIRHRVNSESWSSDQSTNVPKSSLGNTTVTLPSGGIDLVKDDVFTLQIDLKNTDTGTSNRGWDIHTITIAAEAAASGPVDPTITFDNGAYTLGATALDLSSLFTSNSKGTVTYSVKTDGGTSASISGSDFSATAAGTCVVTATQAAETGKYNAKAVDANIVVSAPAATHSVTATTEDADKGTAAAAETTVAEGATTTITASPKTGYVFDHWEVSGTGATLDDASANPVTLTMGTADATVTAYFAAKVCPTSGVVYTMTMKSKSLSSVTQDTEVALVAGDYATENGGVSYLGNKNSDASKAQIKTEAGGIVYFNGNDAYLKVALECPLQPGDLITIEGNASSTELKYLITNTNSRSSYVTSTNTTGTKKYYTVVADDILDDESVVYIWREASGGNKNVHSVTITRPYNVTFVSDHGTAPTTPTKALSFSLTELSDASFTHTGWTANKAVKVGGETKTAGTALATNAAVELTDNTTFTAVWEAKVTKHTVTYYDGTTELGTELVVENSNPTASEIVVPHKLGYTFGGWSTTNGGAAVALNTISVTADMPLYVVWSAVNCATKSGTIYTMSIVVAPLANCTITSTTGTHDLYQYEGVSGGEAILGNKGTSNNCILQTNKTILLKDDNSYIKLDFDCPLKEGDKIVYSVSGNNPVLSTGNSKPSTPLATLDRTKTEFVIPVESGLIDAQTIYIWKGGGNTTVTSISIVRPEKFAVTFNMHGHGTQVEPQNIISGEKVTEPATTDITGYAFGGWYKTYVAEPESYSNAWDFANDVVSAVTELHAKWTALPKMTLTAGAGTGDDVVSYPTVGSAVAVPGCPAGFEKTGYIFAGWAYSPSVSVEGGSFNMPNEDLTLTAQWVDATSVARIGSNYYATLADALLHAAEGEIVLLQDIDVTSQIEIADGVTATIDLAGHKIEYTGTSTLASGVILVHNGGSLTINDSSDPDAGSIVAGEKAYAALMMTKAGDDASKVASLTINGGIFTGYYYAISGNGSRPNTNITINGGTFTATAANDNLAIYHPQNGTLTIYGGSFEGYLSAIEMRAGSLVINGGSFTATAPTFSCNAAGSGTTTQGAAIAIAQHTTKKDIAVTINGGTFTGVKALNESNPQANDPAPQVTMAVTAGTFTGEVSTVDVDKFVSGGSFSEPVAEANCATGYVPETKANGKYGVIVPAQSIDFMAIIDAKGTGDEGKAELDNQLSTKHYDIDGTLNNDRLEAGGFKVKVNDLTISFSVEKEKVVEITTGHISGANIKVNDAAAVAMESDKKHTYYSDDAQAFLITMTTATYNIFKSINIRDPYEVTFEAHGDADPAALQGKPSVILPSATNGTKSLTGWFTEETGGTKIGDATDEYTPTANITLHAQWEDISTDARLASITLDPSTGVLSPAFDPEVTAYTYTMPYGTAAVPTITGATKANPAAKDPVIDAQAAAWGETAHVHGVAASDDTKDYYVQMLRAPKDGICIIKSTPTSGTEADVDGIYQGSAYFKGNAKKLKNEYDYVGVELAAGYTFQAGDKVVLNQTAAVSGTDITKFYIFTEVPAGGKTYVTVDNAAPVQGDNWFDMPAELVGQSALYIGRINNAYCNPTVGYLAVYRPLPPVLNKVTVNGVEGKPNALKEVVIEVAASTTQSELEAIAYEWVSNSDAWTAAHTPVATNAWEFGVANTVTFTDKDGDASVYTITVNKAVPSSDATLSTLSYGTPATAIALADGVYEYDVLLPYGTSDVPALDATAHHIGATIEAIADATAFVDRKATSTVTVKAEDDATTQVYTVNFTVDRFESKVLWDGSTMSTLSDITAAAAAAGVTITSADISVTSFSAKTCEENGKSYTKALNIGGNTKSTRYFAIEIPAGKVAKVSLVYKANGNSARSIIIGTALASVVDESAITSVEKENDQLLHVMTAEMFGGGALYINTTNGFQVHEISLQLADGYGRSAMLGAGVLGTVCVPNNVTIEDIQGVTVYELMGRESQYGKLAFDEIISGELEAGVPYVFQAHRNHMALLYGETHVANPVDKHNGMYGTFTEQTLTELNDVYYFAQKALWGCADLTSLKVPANRAYVKLSEVGSADPNPAPGRRRISMAVNGEQIATGIENTGFESEAPRKVLINGELFIIRGEKMYDAKGQLVK